MSGIPAGYCSPNKVGATTCKCKDCNRLFYYLVTRRAHPPKRCRDCWKKAEYNRLRAKNGDREKKAKPYRDVQQEDIDAAKKAREFDRHKQVTYVEAINTIKEWMRG